MDWWKPLATPTLAVLITAVATALAALIIGPWVQLRISKRQIALGHRQASGAEKSASAALAAAQNAGIHAVARFRQEWINALRADLAELHSLLLFAPQGGQDGREKDIIRLKTRIELLLNPREEASQHLVEAIEDLISAEDGSGAELTGVFVGRSQKILKEEWDRVKSELRNMPMAVNGKAADAVESS